MTKPNLVVFIVADEGKNKDEAEYMQAIAAEIAARGADENTEYLIYKRVASGELRLVTGDPAVLPLDDARYAAVPHLTTELAEAFRAPGRESVHIVGVGHSTLEDMLGVMQSVPHERWYAKAGDPSVNIVSGSYITHLVSSAEDLKKLADNNVKIFAPVDGEDLAALDAEAAARARLVTLDEVPNKGGVNFAAACAEHKEKFLASSEQMRGVLESGVPFACAVVNAGFPVNGERFFYESREAFAHGEALGNYLPEGTALLLMEGGPRNALDREQPTLADNVIAFKAGYNSAQKQRGATPEIVVERFEKGLPYNVVNAASVLAASEQCLAFISNAEAEGYGTMSGAAQFVDNTQKLSGMFPFRAIEAEEQRVRNQEKYNKKGIALLKAEGGQLVIERHPQERKGTYTPYPGAKQFVDETRMAASPLAALPSAPVRSPSVG
jgi:hypothetical protein